MFTVLVPWALGSSCLTSEVTCAGGAGGEPLHLGSGAGVPRGLQVVVFHAALS